MQEKEGESAEFLKKSIGEVGLLTAKDISKREASTTNEDSSFLDILELSREYQKEVIPIISSKGIVGTVDKLRIIASISKENISNLDKIIIKGIMDKKFVSCSSDKTLKEILNTILRTDSKSLILKTKGKFVGLLDYFDILRIFLTTNFRIENPPIIRNAMNKIIQRISAESNLLELKELFVKNKTNYFIVQRGDRDVGVVTIKDILSSLYKNVDLNNSNVENIMSARMTCLEPWQDLNKAMELAFEKRFNQIPIKEGEKIIGILEVKDAVRAYYNFIQNLKQGEFSIKEV